MRRKSFFLIFFFIFIYNLSFGQYFVSDAPPVNYKWRQIELKKKNKLIYPDFMESQAQLISTIADTIRPYMTYGLYDKITNFPITINPSTVLSNGMVTWTPKRVELYTAMPTNSFAIPWLYHLTIHESRHVVQMSNLNQGFTKAVSYVIGEQAPGLASIIMPKYFYEGDAVSFETQMTSYGRGLQPSFSIVYRAMLNEEYSKFNLSQIKLGSYKENIPSIYELGYQVTMFGREYYGQDIWEKVTNYVGRRSYTIFAYYFGLIKYTGKPSNHLIKRTFKDLKKFWHETSQVENTSIITNSKTKYYTSYSSPIIVNDSLLLSLKVSVREPHKFVTVNPYTGEEKLAHYVGNLTSRPIRKNNSLLWTEYKPSIFWTGKNHSIAKITNITTTTKNKIKTSRPQRIKSIKEDIYFITPIDNGYAMIAYDKCQHPSIIITDTLFQKTKTIFPEDENTSFNGMAWDAKTKTLATIILTTKGMNLTKINLETEKIEDITKPSYISLNNLKASNGKLFYTSIYSGKDEVHFFDLINNIESQISTSKYGSKDPIANDSTVFFTTYTRDGYRIARQKINNCSVDSIKTGKFPKNVVNYPFKSWGLPKIDTMDFSKIKSTPKSSRPYRKAGHMFKVHSWLPMYFDINKLMDERQITIGAGATIMSQNTLNTVVTTAGLGYVNNSFIGSGNISYRGLPVILDIGAEYGGGKQLAQYQIVNIGLNKKNYFSTSFTASLPMNFSCGKFSRFLTPSIHYKYYNTLYPVKAEEELYKMSKGGLYNIKEGVTKMTASLLYQSSSLKAKNDLIPQIGHFFQLSTSFNPIDNNFGNIVSLYTGVYLPGILPNNSVLIRGAYQYQFSEYVNFTQKILFPKGNYGYIATENLIATNINYLAPLFYPDWDLLWGNLYVKRFRIDLFGEFATFNSVETKEFNNVYTYGGTLKTDVNVFAIGSEISLGISLYKPSNSKNPMIGYTFGVNF